MYMYIHMWMSVDVCKYCTNVGMVYEDMCVCVFLYSVCESKVYAVPCNLVVAFNYIMSSIRPPSGH